MSLMAKYRWLTIMPPGGNMRELRVGACLSLSGRYSRFGRQVKAALELWRDFDGSAELVLEDDASDLHTLKSALPRIIKNCDVILGPYSTQLTRAAAKIAADYGQILWNHGGSGDDVESAFPGFVVSVLTPASRYAAPFIHRLADGYARAPLSINQGRGAFGRQVCDGAEAAARASGIDLFRTAGTYASERPAVWDMFSAGTFEDDVQAFLAARRAASPPRVVCCVAAGVRDFPALAGSAEGVYGVGQWFPGATYAARPYLGPAETKFLEAYSQRFEAFPEYPAVQAAATAILASHCVRQTASTDRMEVWQAAAELDADTMFGRFRIDPMTGIQVGHEAVLVRWTASGMTRV
jgi:ABC-type branched-subunit amino acid transport system substrate-binding protein